MFSALVLSVAILTNLSQVANAIATNQRGAEFCVEGIVLDLYRPNPALMTLSSDSGLLVLRDLTPLQTSTALDLGNSICASGIIGDNENGQPSANCTELKLLKTGKTPEIVDVHASELLRHPFSGKVVRVRGIVRQVFRDEIDPKYIRLILADNGMLFHASHCNKSAEENWLRQLVDAEIRLTGVYMPRAPGLRKYLGTISAYQPDAIQIIKPASTNPFDVPAMDESQPASATDVIQMGRRKLSGKVIAVMKSHDILLKDNANAVHRIRFRALPSPSYDDDIEVVGYSETDLYRLNLSDAVWRPTGKLYSSAGPPMDIHIADILTDGNGSQKIDPTYHGKPIRIRGTVMDIPNNINQIGIITLKSDGFTIPVDIARNADLAGDLRVGCGLAVAGTCVIESDNWSPLSVFPQTTGITLVVRQPEDVQILYQPPWWTPGKFLLVVLVLILVIIATFIWNRILNRLVSRRSRALVKEQLALAEAELKIGERTRLAIELHDSLSQNLAAVACQVSATKSAVTVNAEETMSNLNTVERMLLSCRSELRRCLWDLRNDALDEQNMTDVIRKVLAPVIGKATLQVRFNVSRSRLDDSTLHTVICIIRELASNAVTHGQATRLTVAGDLDGDNIALSVRENGRGFDASACAGPAEGHFGLAGIRERTDRLCGTFTLKSQPGKGSYAKIAFRLPSNNVED